MARFRALLVGNWEYEDPDGVLGPLKGPPNDLGRMKAALTDAELGLFHAADVVTAQNLRWEEIGGAVLDFVKAAEQDDVLLVYYTGHGERLAGGDLGLCGVNTQGGRVNAQSMSASRMRQWLESETRAKSKIVVLDCCYAGGMKGGDDDELTRWFGTGTMVLSSSGNTTAPDAVATDEPSPFTAALSAALLDPELEGNEQGYLTADRVYERLVNARLSPKPRISAGVDGLFPLARRRRAEAAGSSELEGLVADQVVETAQVRFETDRVVVEWANGTSDDLRLDMFDGNRQAAVRRMVQLADAVIRSSAEEADSADWRAALKALECLGVNLFDTTLPKALRERLAGGLDMTGRTVLKLSLSFAPQARVLEGYPWELLQRFEESGDRAKRRLPLALQPGLLVERQARTRSTSPAPERPVGASVVVFNSFSERLAAAGIRAAEALEETGGVHLLSDTRGRDATWQTFVRKLEQRPSYLLLFVPVRRHEGTVDIWFWTSEAAQGWQSAADIAERLQQSQLRFEAIVLVTSSSWPGEDSMRAVVEAARTLAEADLGPVVFVCHSPAFLRAQAQDLPSFPALLVDALRREDGPGLDGAVYYARDQLYKMTTGALRQAMGVPGYYAAPAERATPPPASTRTAAPPTGGRRPATKPSEERPLSAP